MKNNFYKIVLTLAAVLAFASVFYVYRPWRNSLTQVTVSGESQTKVPPDQAVILFSVVTQNAGAVAAQQANARKIESVMKALEELAAGTKIEISTSNYNLSPEYDYSSARMPKIIGYEARNTLTVTTDDLNQVGAVIDAATKAGANSVEGISFILREDSPLRGDALGIATRQAMTKAEAIATSLNGRVVRIIETVEGGTPLRNTYNTALESNLASNTNVSTRIQPGEINLRAQITLVAEIEVNR